MIPLGDWGRLACLETKLRSRRTAALTPVDDVAACGLAVCSSTACMSPVYGAGAPAVRI